MRRSPDRVGNSALRTAGHRTKFRLMNAYTCLKSHDSIAIAMNMTQYLRFSYSHSATRSAVFVAALLGTLTGVAYATTTQPNGLVVPIVNTGEDGYTVGMYGRHSTLPLFFTSRN